MPRMFQDPTPRIERRDSLCTVVSVGAESTTHTGKDGVVSFRGRNYGATIIGTVAAGAQAHFVQTSDNHVWAIRSGTHYRSAFPRLPNEWAKCAPASLAILELMKRNPRAKAFQSVYIVGFDEETGAAEAKGTGIDGSIQVMFEILPSFAREGTHALFSNIRGHIIGDGSIWGQEITLFDNWNAELIQLDRAVYLNLGVETALTYFNTYHWVNPGSPESVTLINRETSEEYGPFPVEWSESRDIGGTVVEYAVWTTRAPEGRQFFAILPAGSYSFRYSNGVTTSNCSFYHPYGFMRLRGRLPGAVGPVKAIYSNRCQNVYLEFPRLSVETPTISLEKRTMLTRLITSYPLGVESIPDSQLEVGFTKGGVRKAFKQPLVANAQPKFEASPYPSRIDLRDTTSLLDYGDGSPFIILDPGEYKFDLSGYTNLISFGDYLTYQGTPNKTISDFYLEGREVI